MSEISYAQAKVIVLADLRQWMKSLPAAERVRPRISINLIAYSIPDLIAEVERNTEVGKKYVFSEAKRLNYVVK